MLATRGSLASSDSGDEKHENEEYKDSHDSVADSRCNQGPDDQGEAQQGQTRRYREQQQESDGQNVLKDSFWCGFILDIPETNCEFL